MAKKFGWALTILLVCFYLFSASGKFLPWEGKEEMFSKMGFSIPLMQKIGIVEIVITLMLLLPRTAFLGAVLLTAYMGGALCVHLRAGESFVFHIVLGVLVWIAVGLRMPEIFRLAFGIGGATSNTATSEVAA